MHAYMLFVVGVADKMTISSSSASSIGDHEIKERLMREYGEYMSSLKQEFSQRKKNGKLSQHARQALLDWWSAHYNWPYPTVLIYKHIYHIILIKLYIKRND